MSFMKEIQTQGICLFLKKPLCLDCALRYPSYAQEALQLDELTFLSPGLHRKRLSFAGLALTVTVAWGDGSGGGQKQLDLGCLIVHLFVLRWSQ